MKPAAAAAAPVGSASATTPVAAWLYAAWVAGLRQRYLFTAENALEILLKETGRVFTEVLEDAGVYKRTEEGGKAFLRFIDVVNQQLCQ